MGQTILQDPGAQADAVTFFIARMCCRQPVPCSVCLAYVKEAITPRAYPILKQTMLQAVRYQDIDAAFGTLLIEAAATAPSPGRNDDESDQRPG